MINDHIKSQIYSKFSFTPTKGQNKIIENLAMINNLNFTDGELKQIDSMAL